MNELRTEYERNGDRMFEAFWRSVIEFPLYGLRNKLKPLATMKSLAVLIVWSDHDTAIPMRPNLQRWLQLFHGGDCSKVEHEVIVNAAHGLIIEHAQMTAEIILRFHSKHFPAQL